MRLLALTCVLLLVGCGESRGPGATGAGSGGQANEGGKSAGGQAGASVGGSSEPEAGAPNQGGATQGGSGGSGGVGVPGGGGAGGSPMVSMGGQGLLSGVCEGAFLQPSPQILSGQSPPSNLSITGDELELFFNSADVISSYQRASTGVLFPEQATPVAGLGDVCGELMVGGMDVTLDGLRLYISCSDDQAGFVGPLRLATRASRQAAFVLAPEVLGTVGNSISISDDELELFAVTRPGRSGYTVVHQRESLAEPFGPGELVQGLGGPFSFPELSPDGLNLFGTADEDVARLVVASRAEPSGPFSFPTSVGLPAPTTSHLQFAPTVSQTCRLYYLSFAANGLLPSTIDLLGR
jgi:hypothetical protein